MEYKMQELIFNTRKEVMEVIGKLNEIVDEYGSASVADLYNLSGIVDSVKDNAYGWTDVSSAKVSMITLPLNGVGYKLEIEEPRRFK